MSESTVDRFVRDGFIKLEAAVPPDVVAACVDLLWREIGFDCEEVLATGRAGDVSICHPFLVHAAQANHGTRPRFLGQPAIPAGAPYRFDPPAEASSPVELTIMRALESHAAATA